LMRNLGTRHRAAIGITEEADCLSLIVSEETGRISVAFRNEIEYNVSIDRVQERLTRRDLARAADAASAGEKGEEPA